jgi:hypothetical protein
VIVVKGWRCLERGERILEHVRHGIRPYSTVLIFGQPAALRRGAASRVTDSMRTGSPSIPPRIVKHWRNGRKPPEIR